MSLFSKALTLVLLFGHSLAASANSGWPCESDLCLIDAGEPKANLSLVDKNDLIENSTFYAPIETSNVDYAEVILARHGNIQILERLARTERVAEMSVQALALRLPPPTIAKVRKTGASE